MKSAAYRKQKPVLTLTLLTVLATGAAPVAGQVVVSFPPYIQPGDNGSFGAKDQMVVTWQTNESSPVPGAYSVEFGKTMSSLGLASVSARVVDNNVSYTSPAA